VIALRERVRAEVDHTMDEDAAVVRITLRNGRIVEKRVEHTIGSLAHPMSDADLEAKFRGLCGPILAAEQIAMLIDACWRLDQANRLGAIASLAVPRGSEQLSRAGAGRLSSKSGSVGEHGGTHGS